MISILVPRISYIHYKIIIKDQANTYYNKRVSLIFDSNWRIDFSPSIIIIILKVIAFNPYIGYCLYN